MSQKPFSASPAKGGRLMSAISDEGVGVYNYVVKRDWRRVLNREVRAEGHVLFCPKVFVEEDVPSIPMPPTSDPITLIVMLRHPNGKIGIIVGTETTLWRYFGLEDPDYFVDGYIDPTYFDSTETAWKQIGSGFASGARRWECETLDGYLILNNAADLPVTYRITEDTVTPIYELRELAIASVGTIWVQNNHLVCGDIRQIKEDKFISLMSPIAGLVNARVPGPLSSSPYTATINSGVAGVAGNKITVSGFDPMGSFSGFVGMVGTTIRMANGVVRTIVSVESDTEATLNGDPALVEPGVYFYYTGTAVDSWLSKDMAEIFPTIDPDQMIGLKLFWDAGYTTQIIGSAMPLPDPDVIYPITSAIKGIPNGPLSIENPEAYARFDDYSYIDRYQTRTIWSLPGEPRRFGATYPGTITPTDNSVRLDYPVRSIGFNGGQVTITGMKSGNITANAVFFDGINLLMGGGAVTNFYQDAITAAEDAAAVEDQAQSILDAVNSTLVAAQNSLAKAEEALAESPDDADLARAVADAQAAVDDALAAQDLAQKNLTEATAAKEEAEAKLAESEDVEIQLSDSLSDFSRLEDLQNDGAAILKARVLKKVGVVFTETSIFIARYSSTISGFVFELVEIPEGAALFYRNTPILINSEWILYATENEFMRFDMNGRVPAAIPIMGLCDNIFFEQAKPENMERIFSTNNSVTGEVFVCFPSDTEDRALRFDYKYNTISTTSAEYTSGASVVFPGTSQTTFVMGSTDGKVLRYGMVAGASRKIISDGVKSGSIVTAEDEVFSEIHIGQTVVFENGGRFGIVRIITASSVEVCGSGAVTSQGFYIDPTCHHRLGVGYKSTVESGGDYFGTIPSEKNLDRYEVMLSRFSPDTEMNITIRSGVNTNGIADQFSFTMTPPELMQPVMLSDYCIGDRIEVDGINNPCEITERNFHLSPVNTRGFSRRPS